MLFNYDRMEEQHFFLKQLRGYVEEYQPDALAVSGDVYQTSMPSAATQKMFTEAVLEMHKACQAMTIVITGGNHDSASRLEIDRKLWQELGVHVLGRLQLTEDMDADFDKHIIAVGNKGLIAAIPHVYPQNFPVSEVTFFDRLAEEVARRNVKGLPTVLMAHLTVKGCDLTGHTQYQDSIGTIEDVPLQLLGTGYSYIALGHIHHEQNVGPRARYSGSPLAVSFDEDYPHSVSLVDIGSETTIRQLPIANLHPLQTIPHEPADFDEAVTALRCSEFNGYTPYVRLNVLTKNGLAADAVEKANNAAAESGSRFCTFKLTRVSEAGANTWADITPDELKEMRPTDIAQKYMEGRGISIEGAEEMMQTVIDIINREDRQ
jgi:exonuclease SbcD